MTLPADTDRLDRFLLPHAGVRGVRVHLHETWQRIAASEAYPAAVGGTLGEAVAACALFTAHAKVDGRLSVQLRGEGPMRALFAECTAQGTLRGLAHFDPAAAQAAGPDLRRLAGDDAVMAITIENPGPGRDPTRYQGLVGMAAAGLAEAFETYFRQSEQLPTRLLLTTTDHSCAGLMLQKLPGDSGDDDGWNRANALFDTLREDELQAWTSEQLLRRLFAEEEAQPLGGRALAFGCSCSRERVEGVLMSLGHEEAMAATAQHGHAEVRCEFCGQSYMFDPAEVDALFTDAPVPMAAPDRLQ
ncbi:Hsp33 family molecular chaperone HslO [Luteimonas sp. MHLX1A]|uniref:Hsp33 family molecular chaperone HslO n=1 Tax=Alterluteimonas muca TaxID=2878684 RepID=UPI001E40E4B5|nr:Hsp33 family molecular chaperone HslO [Luteimonas sp. MHLX1A]MCD9047693.1 Hsp33 family molecular chaperone HslO [Luteimonas sp. MHLX1A]